MRKLQEETYEGTMHFARLMLKAGSYFVFFGLGVILIFWPFIEGYLGPQNKMSALGVVVVVLASFVLYFDSKIDELHSSAQQLKHLSLGEALRESFAARKYHVKELRIFAFTSDMILPIVSDITCDIENCYLLLHRFPENGRAKDADKLNSQVNELVRRWLGLHRRGKIRNLAIALYDDFPHDYAIILDTQVLITGAYSPDETSRTGSWWDEPCVVFASSVAAAMLITKNISRFDRIFAYWRKHSTESTGKITDSSPPH